MDDPLALVAPGSFPAEKVAGWCRSRPVRLCVAFGSRSRGEGRPDSDLDLAVWVSPLPPPEERLAWLRELTEALELPVQLVFVTPSLDPVLGFQIAREGRAVYQARPSIWLTERVRLWQLYQDALPFLRLSRRRLKQFADEVRCRSGNAQAEAAGGEGSDDLPHRKSSP